MNKPLRSRFMGHDYKIVWQPKGSIKLEAGRCYGLTDEEEQSIQIEDSLPPTLERSVLIHEVIHQLVNSSALNEVDGEMEEKLAEFFGEALTSHIKDNPLFWRYVTRALKKD